MIKNFLTIASLIMIFTGFIFPAGNNRNNLPEAVPAENPSAEFVPQWAKKVIWYQIFPERFMNGDASNDPKLEDSKGSWPYDLSSAWEIHPWTSDWYEMQPYEKENGKNIWYNMQRRRYGGDIQGIKDKLDYMQELGVTAIYLNPVFESPSLHKYDGATYHHIDPNFGPDPDGDRKMIASEVFDDPSTWQWTSADKLFLEFIKEVHNRGMYVIVDGVFNHMGTRSPAFMDLVKNQMDSRYADWFTVKQWDDSSTGEKFDYEGWFGAKDLPEIKEDDKGIVDGPKKYIYAATKRWMDPYNNGDLKSGIDGWRLDVAFCVDHDFWKDWRKHVKSINKEAYITGEVFLDSLAGFKDYLAGDEFDAVMDYPFLYTCSEYFVDEKHSINTTEFDRLLRELREMFPAGVAYVLQNLLDSHDTHRFASHIVNKNLAPYRKWGEFHGKSKGENPEYNTRKPSEEERELQKLVILFQMTYPGAPMVYYGDEAGMWGANDPCDRKPMMWKEMDFSDAAYLPGQTKKEAPDKVEFDDDLFSYYKKVISIRNSTPALQLGDFATLLTDDEKELYSFKRSYDKQDVIVVINNSVSSQSADLNVAKGSYKDLMNDKTYEAEEGKLNISLDAKKGSVLVKE